MNNGQQMQRRDDRALTPQQKLNNLLTSERVKNQIALALPKSGMTPERMLRIVLTAVNRTPLLFNCTDTSVLAAVIQSAQLGLEPDGVMGLAYLVPYGNQCQFIVGYRGLIELARRSGLVANVDAQVVHVGDYFKYRLGLNPTLEHVPMDMLEFESEELRRQAIGAMGGQRPSNIVAAYCVVTLTDGSKVFRVVGRSYVDKVRKASRGSDNPSSPWKQWEEQMWMKTAIKQGLKLIPLSPDDKVTHALNADESVVSGITDFGKIVSEMPEPVVDPSEADESNQGATAQQAQSQQPAAATPARARRAPAQRQEQAQPAASPPPGSNPKQPPLPGFGDDVFETEGTSVAASPAQVAADDFVRQHREGAAASAEPPPGPPLPVEDGSGAPGSDPQSSAPPARARRVPRA